MYRIIKNIESKIELKRFETSLQEEWDNFVEHKSINGTFLHTRKFYNHNPLNKDDDCSFLIYKKNEIIGVIAFSLVQVDDKTVLISHSRATYGGFVFNKEVGVSEAVDMVKKVVDHSKMMGVSEIIIKNSFRIFFSQLSDEFDYALWYNNFKIKYRELEIAILIDDKKIVQANYSHGALTGMHKGRKHLALEESTEFESFWLILEKSLSAKYNCKPTHNYEQFIELLNNVGSDKIKLFVAKRDESIIAGILVFIVNSFSYHAQYIAYEREYQSLRPLNALIDYIVDYGYERGVKYFNLGMANEKHGRVMNQGLFNFKESFGGRGVLRETMYLYLNDEY